MNESVYSLIPPKQEQRAAPPMYRSKHRTLAPTCSTFGLQGTSRVVGNVAGEPETAPPVTVTRFSAQNPFMLSSS